MPLGVIPMFFFGFLRIFGEKSQKGGTKLEIWAKRSGSYAAA